MDQYDKLLDINDSDYFKTMTTLADLCREKDKEIARLNQLLNPKPEVDHVDKP